MCAEGGGWCPRDACGVRVAGAERGAPADDRRPARAAAGAAALTCTAGPPRPHHRRAATTRPTAYAPHGIVMF